MRFGIVSVVVCLEQPEIRLIKVGILVVLNKRGQVYGPQRREAKLVGSQLHLFVLISECGEFLDS